MTFSNSSEESSYNCIETGRLNGRWTYEQHQLFLQGLNIYGKNWKKIESIVKTRSGSQIRSHAQKYFSKLVHKQREPSDDLNSQFTDGKNEQSVFTALSENRFENNSSITQILEQLKAILNLIDQSNVNPLNLFSYHFFQMMKQPQQLINNNFFKQFIDFSESTDNQSLESLSNYQSNGKISFRPLLQKPVTVPLIAQISN